MTAFKEKRNLLIAGIIIGVIAVFLVIMGNPKNMGFCIACFVRDIAGATKFQSAAPVRYLRPEIIGLVFGSFLMAVAFKEFRPRGGSAPMTRFIIAVIVMIGALAFLGCPFRMILRLAGGDLNALVALIGFACGIATACFFLNRGFNLGRTQEQRTLEGVALPAINVVLLVIAVAAPSLLAFSETGPGSMHAPILISLAAGLVVGILAQRTRLCMVGGIRDTILLKDATLLIGFCAIFLSALVMNLVTGNFKLGFTGQPIAHSAHVWNFLGMYAAGLGCAMLGGCPLRQIILAGEGNSDSAISVLGLFVGAAISHNFGLAGSADSVVDGVYKVGGISANGKVAVICGIVILLGIACYYTFAKKRESK